MITCLLVLLTVKINSNPNVSSPQLTNAGGNDNPNMALSESFAVGIDLGGPGTVLAGDGNMDFVIGYPAQLGDDSDRFPCGSTFDTSCFGIYFFEVGQFDQPGTRFVYKTDAYNGFPAGLLTQIRPLVIDQNPQTSQARPGQ